MPWYSPFSQIFGSSPEQSREPASEYQPSLPGEKRKRGKPGDQPRKVRIRTESIPSPESPTAGPSRRGGAGEERSPRRHRTQRTGRGEWTKTVPDPSRRGTRPTKVAVPPRDPLSEEDIEEYIEEEEALQRQIAAEDVLASAPLKPQHRRQTKPSALTTPVETTRAGPSGTKTTEKSMEQRITWDSTPNVLARTFFGKLSDRARVAKTIREQLSKSTGLSEPLYAFRDVEIRDAHWQVMDRIQQFAMKFYNYRFDKTESNETRLNDAFAKMREATIVLIGSVASGGPGGSDGWKDLFYEGEKRTALVCAIVGNIITEQVIEHSFFGGSKTDGDALDKIMRKNIRADGFDRNARYAEHIAQALNHTPGQSVTLPAQFHQHVAAVVETILVHLDALDARTLGASERRLREQVLDLYNLVAYAGILSLFMRLDPHTVYYITPTFKEQRFESRHMEAYNKSEMEATHPRQRTDWPADWDQREIARARNDEPLTQIVLMNGISAYRRGGWEDPVASNPWGDEGIVYQPGMENVGIRSRHLSQAWVYCRWGRPRNFERGQPADRKEEHGIQWVDPGFVEFDDVVDEAKSRGRARARGAEKRRGKGKGKERA